MTINDQIDLFIERDERERQRHLVAVVSAGCSTTPMITDEMVDKAWAAFCAEADRIHSSAAGGVVTRICLRAALEAVIK